MADKSLEDIIIRRASQDDIEQVNSLWVDLDHALDDTANWAYNEEINSVIRHKKRNGHKCYLYVVQAGDSIVSTATLEVYREYRFFGKKIGYGNDFVTNDKERGKGIGSRLIWQMGQEALKMGCEILKLTCRKERVHLYERFGFQIVSFEGGFYGMSLDVGLLVPKNY